jgi:uncharacterized small protein (DUF1192 family)
VSPESGVALRQELARLRAELAERRASLPAHSIRPHQLLALEDLEERIAELSRRLGSRE